MESSLTVEADGAKIWRNEEGQLHREDGPAVIFPNGSKISINYYDLPETATLRDVVIRVRNDEQLHTYTNHIFHNKLSKGG